MPKSQDWIFSLIGYDEAELESLRKTLSKETFYAIFKKDFIKKRSGPYIEGYAAFRDAYSLEKVKQWFGPKVNVRMARMSTYEMQHYGGREGNFEEFGFRPGSLRFNDWMLLNADSKSTKTSSIPKTKPGPIFPKESPKRKREEPIDEKSTKPFHGKLQYVFVFSLDS